MLIQDKEIEIKAIFHLDLCLVLYSYLCIKVNRICQSLENAVFNLNSEARRFFKFIYCFISFVMYSKAKLKKQQKKKKKSEEPKLI